MCEWRQNRKEHRRSLKKEGGSGGGRCRVEWGLTWNERGGGGGWRGGESLTKVEAVGSGGASTPVSDSPSPRPTPWSRERHKRQQTGRSRIGQAEESILQVCHLTLGTRAKQGMGKIPKPKSPWYMTFAVDWALNKNYLSIYPYRFRHLYVDTPARKLGKRANSDKKLTSFSLVILSYWYLPTESATNELF